jgi:hypothetical protein
MECFDFIEAFGILIFLPGNQRASVAYRLFFMRQTPLCLCVGEPMRNGSTHPGKAFRSGCTRQTDCQPRHWCALRANRPGFASTAGPAPNGWFEHRTFALSQGRWQSNHRAFESAANNWLKAGTAFCCNDHLTGAYRLFGGFHIKVRRRSARAMLTLGESASRAIYAAGH